ncbi:MAG: LOG family protein [Candidatus Gastranaerophilales bacterium]|nr:LOG family protein [Candidatus Gastranaerophilales bacterium]
MKISFSPEITFTANKYKTAPKKRETVAVLGSSKETDQISEYINLCSDVTKNLIIADKNILTGCGSFGIMGAAYNSAKENSVLNGKMKPAQNLAIVKKPLWGDEDLENCVIIGTADSESQRIEKFHKKADKFLIFPGGASTIQEAATLIASNHYPPEGEERKKIVLVGKDYFAGLSKQYDELYRNGLLNVEPDELFTVVDTKKEILESLD